ncbi:MAG: TerB family tellurite resistance protein [Rudaea sp.]|uniref:J domain-containing protein n=1 Tax=unclassified Rudaea TaxID=2627037 RepID=UPI0010F50766|nr:MULTISPECIES: J domain-containing protein [unclassified Rudaea]MBN8885170.1 TerB family tellurite resistance protein [Rudaea sp.]
MAINLLVPLAVALGGAVWRAFRTDQSFPSAGLQGRYSQDDVGLRLSLTGFRPQANAILQIHARNSNGGFLKAAHRIFADNDGDFSLGSDLEGDSCHFYVPHGAILGAEGDSLIISARIANGSAAVTEDIFHVELIKRPFSIVRYLEPLLMLGKILAQSDGPLVREEVRYLRELIRDKFGGSETELEELRLLLKPAQDMATSDVAEVLRYRMPHLDLDEVAKFFINVAAADALVNPAEANCMKDMLRLLGAREVDLHEFISSLGLSNPAPELEACLTVLSLTGKPTQEELLKAWRRAVRDFHPDRYQSRDLPDAVKSVLAQRTLEINSAYETLAKAYGYK